MKALPTASRILLGVLATLLATTGLEDLFTLADEWEAGRVTGMDLLLLPVRYPAITMEIAFAVGAARLLWTHPRIRRLIGFSLILLPGLLALLPGNVPFHDLGLDWLLDAPAKQWIPGAVTHQTPFVLACAFPLLPALPDPADLMLSTPNMERPLAGGSGAPR